MDTMVRDYAITVLIVDKHIFLLLLLCYSYFSIFLLKL